MRDNHAEKNAVGGALYEIVKSSAGGWKPEEEELLFSEVEKARKSGWPLRTVFERVAAQTGRKPNSIRNYYYARIKEDESRADDAGRCAAFVPFTDEEMRELLKTVLHDQAKGISVRACTLRLGNGDNKAMLRYQNKYRSLIKSNPELVREVVAQMREMDIPVFDPYHNAPLRRSGRPKKNKESLVDVVAGMVNDLNQVDGLDVTAFFESLGALAVGACKGAQAMKRLEELERGDAQDVMRLRAVNAELKEQLDSRARELEYQKERFSTLLSLFRQLMSLNREFLGQTSVVKMSSLSSYIRELSKNVSDCERMLLES